MASFVKQFLLPPFAFLALLSLFTPANAGRYFFSKMTRTDEASNPTVAIPEGTTPEERINSRNSRLDSQNGYGLYGRGPEQFSQTSTGTAMNSAESMANEELINSNFRNEYKNRFENKNNEHGDFSDEFTKMRYRPNYDQRNAQYPYGMSDTRHMENGRYYYDVNAKRYGYGFESDPMKTNAEENRSYGGGERTRGGNEGYGEGNGNEFKKFMNERTQEEYIP